MKNISIVLVGLIALAFLPCAALAGINPGSAGLPSVVLATGDNNFYQVSATVPGNRASVMCVACHTRNPGMRTNYRATRADYLTAGSHWVTSNFADSAKGGGYSDGTSPRDRATRVTAGTAFYFADNTSGNMTVANGWYGRPKYGVSGPDNTYSRATGTEVICESCHNILHNIGPSKLLATAFANGGGAQATAINGTPGSNIPALCIGCHSDMDAGVNAEWQFHPVAAASTWGGTHHHRNTPSTAVYLGAGTALAADGGMANMTAADYNQLSGGLIYQMWAAGPGTLTGTRALSWTANPARVRNAAGTDNGQISPRGTNLLCTNCHRAHNAESTAGATILMRGSDTAAIGTILAPTGSADGWRGTARMNDRGGRGTAFSSTNALCMACHQ